MLKRESTGFKEGPHECRPHPDPLGGLPKSDFQLAQVAGREVGQLYLLQIPPHPFVRIEFGGVGRKVLQAEASSLIVHEASDRGGLVGLHIVPDKDDSTGHMPEQMPQKHEHLRSGDGAAANQEVQLPLGTDTRDGGKLRPTVPVGHHWGLPFGRPSSDTGRDQAEAGLVREDQRGFLLLGFFLMRGHSCWSQRWTSRSSRSEARLVGRWYDHPHCRRSLGT